MAKHITVEVEDGDVVIIINSQGNFERFAPHGNQVTGSRPGNTEVPGLKKKAKRWQSGPPPGPPGEEGLTCEWVWHNGRWYWCCY